MLFISWVMFFRYDVLNRIPSGDAWIYARTIILNAVNYSRRSVITSVVVFGFPLN